MEILVTGGAGFIGSSLVYYHLNQGDTVHVIDNLSTGSLKNLKEVLQHPKLKCYLLDLNNFENLSQLLQSIDIVYHFAAVVGVLKVVKDPINVLDVNIQSTLFLLDTMRSIQSKARLIMASTSEIYGKNNSPFLSEDYDAQIPSTISQRKNYALSKIVDEAYCLSFFLEHDIQVTILRIFNVIGRNQSGSYGMVIPRFINAALKNDPLIIYGSGQQKRSFCDIRDFILMLAKIIHEPKTIGCILNIGNDEEDVSIYDLANKIIFFSNSQSQIKRISYVEAYGEEFDDFQTRRPDLTRLKKLIQLNYQWDLDSSLKDMIEDFRALQ
jgi:UDP-glucose 4-epimerase